MTTIPKKIHYCWFGGNPLTELGERCLESWKKFFPDYEIIEWNESNYDVNKIPYIKDAYEAKKYAFVSDFARFDILYQYGGIYFDTDVEVIKDMTDIIEKGAFAGIESPGDLAAGLGIASPAASPLVKEIIESYKSDSFINEKGELNLQTVVTRVSEIFAKHGFTKDNKIQHVGDFTIYPVDYFAPKDIQTYVLNITENTRSIHHYDGSWATPARRKFKHDRHALIVKYGITLGKILGFFPWCRWVLTDFGFWNITKRGFKKFFRIITGKK